jgi:predicted extracellular nuclease
VRAKRAAQAEYLAGLVQARLTARPDERLVLVGDFNAFQFSDGLVALIGTIKGTPAPASEVVLASSDLVNPDLVDLVDSVPAAERYSYVFDGNA